MEEKFTITCNECGSTNVQLNATVDMEVFIECKNPNCKNWECK